MNYYSFNRPRRDGRLSRPCWLTDSGRFTHKEVTWPAASLAQDRESTPAEPAVLTTMPRHQLHYVIVWSSPSLSSKFNELSLSVMVQMYSRTSSDPVSWLTLQ